MLFPPARTSHLARFTCAFAFWNHKAKMQNRYVYKYWTHYALCEWVWVTVESRLPVCAKIYMHCTHTTAHSMTLSSTMTAWLRSLWKRLTESTLDWLGLLRLVVLEKDLGSFHGSGPRGPELLTSPHPPRPTQLWHLRLINWTHMFESQKKMGVIFASPSDHILYIYQALHRMPVSRRRSNDASTVHSYLYHLATQPSLQESKEGETQLQELHQYQPYMAQTRFEDGPLRYAKPPRVFCFDQRDPKHPAYAHPIMESGESFWNKNTLRLWIWICGGS